MGRRLDAARTHGFERRLSACRSASSTGTSRSTRIRTIGTPSHVRLSKVNYHTVADNDATTDQYLAGDLDFTDRFNVVRKGPAAADPGRSGRARSLFCHGDVRLQSRQASLRRKSQAAPGAQHGSGPRNSDELRRARRRSARLQHDASARWIRSRHSRLGETFRRTRVTPWRASSIRKRDTRTAIRSKTVLTYASGGPGHAPLHGSAVGDVADEFGREGADLQRRVESVFAGPAAEAADCSIGTPGPATIPIPSHSCSFSRPDSE